MVKMLTNLFNKRKRLIKSLNIVVDDLIAKNKNLEKSVRVMKAEKDLSQRELVAANKTILDLTNEIKYLKMQIENTKGEVNSKYY